MPKFGSRYSNVTTFTVATMFAYGFAFFVVGSILVMSGAKEVQAPLLITLSLATFASGLVGAVTTSTVSHSPSARLAEQRGNAAFVFSNSSGTFITLVTAAAECWEAHAPKVDTGLALLLAGFGVTDKEMVFGWYFALLVPLVVIALGFVLIGASRLSREKEVDEAALALVRSCSVGLLVVGLAAGTPWGVIPYGAREAANIWAIIGWTTVFVISVGVFSVVVSHGFGAFFSLLANGLIHLGVSLKALSTSQKFRKALRQFAVGCVRLAALFLVARLLLAAANWAFGYLTSIPPEGYATTIDALVRGLTSSAIAVLVAGSVIALLVSCLLLWPAVKRLAIQAWQQLQLGWSNAKVTLGSLSRKFTAWCGATLARLRTFRLPSVRWPRLGWPRLTWPRLPFGYATAKNPTLSRGGFRAFTSNAARTVRNAVRDFGLAYIPRGPITRRALVGASAIMLAGSFVVRKEPDFAPVDLTIPLPLVPDLVVDPVELDWSPSPVAPPLENVRTAPVSVCELPAGAADWANGSDDKFEIPLERCELPRELQRSTGALVLVGLASSVGNAEREDRRALSRGTALARWAYYRLPNQNDVYVLHLGTAQRVIPLRRYQDLFGKAVGERPVAGLLVTPEPEDATLYSFDVAEQLSDYMVRRGVADDFTRCTLYLFRPEAREEYQLQPVEFFDCRRAP